MSGPWEKFQTPTAERGPWDAFGGGAATAPAPNEARSLADAVMAGIQSSATALAIRGKLPSQQLPENAPWYHRIAAGGANMVTDLPLSVVAALPGAAAGGAAGSAVPVIGNAVGAVVGGGATAFGVPMAIREALTTAYGQDSARSWADVWEITKSAATGLGKGAVIGGATMGAGRVVGAALPVATGAVTRGTAAAGAELVTMTTTAAALEGHMPTWQEFMDNAILLGGLKGAVHTAGKLRNIYAETGKTPAEVRMDAEANPKLAAELAAPGEPLPAAYRELAFEERVRAAIDADPRPELLRETISQAERGETPRLGESTAIDPVKYEYVTDSQTAAEVLKGVSQLYAGELNKQARGVVTDKQVALQALKDASGLEPHEIGKAESAETIFGRAHMLRGASERAAAKLREHAGKSEAELSVADKIEIYAELERVGMLYKDLTGAGAEAGRALHILRSIKRDPSMLGEAETLVKLMEKNVGKGAFGDIARMAAALKDPAQMAKFAKEATQATSMEKVIEAWKAAILSGPLTHMANIMGNVAKFALEIPENVLTTGITAVRKAAQHDAMAPALFKAKALSPLIGLKLGIRDALVVAGEIWKGKGEHLEKSDVYRTAIEGQTGHVVRTPFRMLAMEDALFRIPAERGKAYEMAVERAINEGLAPDTREFTERVTQYTNDPAMGLAQKQADAAVKAVEDAGGEAVFSQRLGPRMEMAQRAMAGSPMQFVVPFVRTPANLVSWAVQHSPFFLLSKRWRDDFAAGGELRDRALSRVIVGSMLSFTAYELVKEGMLTGGGMFNPEERSTKAAAGWQPYSIKIGDKYYSYQRMEPTAKVLGLVADLMEMAEKTGHEGDRFKTMAAALALFGNATISTTYLSGLSATFNALTDPQRYSENFTEQYASSLVPKIIGQTAALIDPHKRQVEGVVDAIQAQIPFLRERLMPQRDVWGEKKPNERLFGVLPVTVTEVSKEKVRTEAARLELAITDVPKFVVEPGPTKHRDRRIELTQEQRDVVKATSGKFAMDILAPIVNSPDWEKIPDFAKAEVYKRVIEAGKKVGRFEGLPPEAAERLEMRDKIIEEINRQTLGSSSSEPIEKRLRYGAGGERK